MNPKWRKDDFVLEKADTRPALYGWAPGDYLNACRDCKNAFIGGKRAWQCAECAYKAQAVETHKPCQATNT
jgi:hypothetical protein